MPRGQERFQFGPFHNSNFLSNHWLEHRLPNEPEWAELAASAAAVLERLRGLWAVQRGRVAKYGDEASLEEAFIRPVLDALGWKIKPQAFLRGREPDYALFMSDAALDAALKIDRKLPEFWKYPRLVGEAKAWDVSLDRPRMVDNRREYPPEQAEWYLNQSGLEYAILTNGRLWRLIPRQLSSHQPRFQTYLECDLQRILEAADGEARKKQATFDPHWHMFNDFLQFFLFFNPLAFETVAGREPLIERATKGSYQYRIGVSAGLKSRVFEALRLCIDGFLSLPANRLNPGVDMPECREQSFVLLYRLLFIMYAEDRRLLPYGVNRLYTNNRSLGRHREEIEARLDRLGAGPDGDYSKEKSAIWGSLFDLFDLIDRGHVTYDVPRYNGGLFDPDRHPFFSNHAISDFYLARIIDKLSRAIDPEHRDAGLCRIDYRDLAIQHLGGIYEGLLEALPQYAAERMMLVRPKDAKDGEEKVSHATDPVPAGWEATGQSYEPGEVFLLYHKGERRASGSYYTPDHIVNYIVENTLGPLCRQIEEGLNAEIAETESAFKTSRGDNREAYRKKLAELKQQFDDRVLRLRVVDPAMGSGHFLLRACQYLAEQIATNPLAGDDEAARLAGDESLLSFWKRRVVERCIYGVDFNPLAVELAKLALWLETVAIGKPLSFLDHHLRAGNSLVGGWMESLGGLPGELDLVRNAYTDRVNAMLPTLLRPLADIYNLPSESADQIKEKERIYRRTFEPVREPFRLVADLWTGAFFARGGRAFPPQNYHAVLDAFSSPPKFRELSARDWFAQAVAASRSESVNAFHWELEFPEVFFGPHSRDLDGGFHAVIGNPPYDVLAEKEIGRDISAFVSFLRAQREYQPSFRGKNNLYKLFICRALTLLAEGGRLGFITPMAVLGDDQAAEIRKQILRVGAFTTIDAFPQKDDPERRVFREAKLSTAVFTLVKTRERNLRTRPFVSRVHPGEQFEAASPRIGATTEAISQYDPSNVAVVSCSQADWDLAVRMTSTGQMQRLGEFAEFFQGEVNETNERAKGNLIEKSSEGGQLVVRGAAICLYVCRAASQGDDILLDVSKFLRGKSPGTKASHHNERRVGLQESCPQNNFRRIIAALVPAGQFFNHTVNYCTETSTAIPLEFVLALLNSKLSDWYFRLGSTNAHVSHYQIYNLPCPMFAPGAAKSDVAARDAALKAIVAGDSARAFDSLRPLLAEPPFSPAVRDVTIDCVNRICAIEQARGEIARSERSHLDPKAQPYQDFIDRLFYAMAGLSDDEARGLEERLATML